MALSNAALIAIQNSNYTTNLMTASAAAWVGYDYLLTVRRESRLFWKRKVTAASALFFANRYLALLYYVVLAYYSRLVLSYPGCRIQDDINISIKYLEYLPWAVFSALRVHALTQKNWFLTAFTFFWSVLAFPIDYYGDFHHRSYTHDSVLGCTSEATTPTFLSLLGTIFIRGGLVIGDVVVIGVTWKAAYEARSEGSMSSLMRVMFKNGTMYFIILLVLNVLHIIFIFLPNSPLHIPFTNTSYVVKLSEPLTAILVSHFMLDLHETHQALAHQGSELSTLQIMSVDIGQPYSPHARYEEQEDWAVAPNRNSDRTESERLSEESREVSSSTVPSPNRHSEIV